MSKTIATVEDLVDAFGGPTKVAEWAGMSNHTGVSNWCQRGFIPTGWHLRLLVECRRRGLEIDVRQLFGLSEDDAALLEGRSQTEGERLAV